MMKEFIIDLCAGLEKTLNLGDVRHEVTFFLGFKPDTYFLPQVHYGHGMPNTDNIMHCIYAEIFVNRTCIFRESYVLKEEEETPKAEAEVMNRILQSVFNYGVTGSKTSMENFLKARE